MTAAAMGRTAATAARAPVGLAATAPGVLEALAAPAAPVGAAEAAPDEPAAVSGGCDGLRPASHPGSAIQLE
jgi:hypothetical protein